MQPQDLQALVAKVQSGQSTEEEELELIKAINVSFEALTKRLEEMKIEKLKGEITA